MARASVSKQFDSLHQRVVNNRAAIFQRYQPGGWMWAGGGEGRACFPHDVSGHWHFLTVVTDPGGEARQGRGPLPAGARRFASCPGGSSPQLCVNRHEAVGGMKQPPFFQRSELTKVASALYAMQKLVYCLYAIFQKFRHLGQVSETCKKNYCKGLEHIRLDSESECYFFFAILKIFFRK